jgi:hypothetical protein
LGGKTGQGRILRFEKDLRQICFQNKKSSNFAAAKPSRIIAEMKTTR